MAITGGLGRFYNFLANMGLVLRDDPPKVIDMTGRQWGQSVDGLALSVREIPQEDPAQQTVLSVVIRNEGPEPKTLIVPGWLFFYELQLDAPLTAYGSQLLKPERRTERMEVTLAAGQAKETGSASREPSTTCEPAATTASKRCHAGYPTELD